MMALLMRSAAAARVARTRCKIRVADHPPRPQKSQVCNSLTATASRRRKLINRCDVLICSSTFDFLPNLHLTFAASDFARTKPSWPERPAAALVGAATSRESSQTHIGWVASSHGTRRNGKDINMPLMDHRRIERLAGSERVTNFDD